MTQLPLEIQSTRKLVTPRLQGNEKALRSAGLLKTGRSTYVPWDTQQVEQIQGQRPTGSGLYGLEGPKGGLLNGICWVNADLVTHILPRDPGQ